MRLPYAAPVIAIYLACVVLTVIPGITHQEWFQDHYILAAPFRAAALLLPVGIFLAMFVIKKPIALLVPIAGILLGAIILRYAAQFPTDLSDTAQPGFATVVWRALKFGVPPAFVVAGFGYLAALHWAPRAGLDNEPDEVGPGRTLALMPPRRELIVGFAVVFAFSTMIDVIGAQHFDSYVLSQFAQIISVFAAVFVFFAVFGVNRWWSAIFPLLYLAEGVLALASGQDNCITSAHCFGDATWFSIKYIGPAYALVFFLALLAAQWARPSSDG